ncbi:MAG: hypothetical protein ACFFB0_09415 [Promethearchaeota archaeon]
MPEDKEKVEDFISLWRKKMETEIKKPSAIAETLDRMKEVEKENEDLRSKIKQNIELITKTEQVVKQTLEENERLKEEVNKAETVSKKDVRKIQQENLELNNKIKSITNSLIEKDVQIKTKDKELELLQNNISDLSKQLESITSSIPEKEEGENQALIEELKSELTKRKSQINELMQKIENLTTENESLNEMLIEKEKTQQVDYVVPVDTSKTAVIKPIPSQTSSQTLEILCQDLQADLNKYKRIIDKMTREKTELQETIESGGFQLEPAEFKELKKENEELKSELSNLQASIQTTIEKTQPPFSVEIYEDQIKELQEQIKERDLLITELRSSQSSQIKVPSGPVSNLVEELQSRINKLKISLDEKNKIIEDLKSS